MKLERPLLRMLRLTRHAGQCVAYGKFPAYQISAAIPWSWLLTDRLWNLHLSGYRDDEFPGKAGRPEKVPVEGG